MTEAQVQFAQGNALAAEGKLDAALACYDRAIALDPAYADAHSNRGNLFARVRRFEEALGNYEKAAALSPRNPLFASNRGAMLHHLKRHAAALAAYDHAIACAPEYLDAHINRGQLLADMQRHAEARASFETAIALSPDAVQAHWNLALLALVQGDFADGWKRYEWRWKKQPFIAARRNYLQPLWLGEEEIAGKTLLIHPEQGFGDFIQFCRYVPLLVARGATVVLETPGPLCAWMQSLAGGATVVRTGDPLPPFDLHCPIMSLPLAMRTTLDTIPAQVPYLSVPAAARAKWQQRLGPKRLPRIGLVWSGAAGHVNDHNRSLPLAQLAPLLALPAEFHALQLEVREADRPHLGPIRLHTDALADFTDTAALAEAMDLIVCVDTSAAHVAGALGKPTWLMLPAAPDFRWLLARSDSPWYPGMRLFRQSTPGDWAGVIATIIRALTDEGIVTTTPHSSAEQAAIIEEAFAEAVKAQQQGNMPVAQAIYEEILRAEPRHLQTLVNLSSIYLRLNLLEEALGLLERGLAVDETQPVLHYNYGRVLMAAKMQDEAVRRYTRAIELSPQTGVFYSNRGIALFELNRYEEAIASYDRAIALEPNTAEYYNNRGNAHGHLMHIDAAIADYRKAVSLFPGMGDAHFNWALFELMKGEYAEGWKRHEWRWEKPAFAVDRRNLPAPLWLGKEDLNGKTILIWPEQGLGDVLQMSRYVPLLEARGARVILEVHAALVELLKTLSPTVTVIPRKATPPAYDYQCPIMSLPLAFGTTLETIPASMPYVSVAPEKRAVWQRRLGEKRKPRIGLVWSGSTTHLNDRNRSLPLAQLAPLFALPYEFHSLQLEVRESDRPHMHHLHSHAEAIGDFTDTAALVEAMDMVVSVDTSVAHLAGALGKPLWMLIPFIPDFRWLLAREDSPWYPSARIFRQQQAGEWAPVIAQVVKALTQQGL